MGSETSYFLWSHFRFEWVGLFKSFMFCLIMAFHIGTFNKCHSFWKYETHRFSAPSGKYEQKWVCPFRIKCSIFAVHFCFFGERHLFLTFLSFSPFLSLSLSRSCFSTFSVSLLFLNFLRLTPLFLSLCFLYLYRCLSVSFYHLLMCNLPLTLSSVCTVESQCLPPGMHRLDWLSSITWDGLTRMQLVCAFPHPLNHYRKDYKSCAGYK